MKSEEKCIYKQAYVPVIRFSLVNASLTCTGHIFVSQYFTTIMSRPNIDYETTVFTLKPDHIGPNKATLLHARTQNSNNGNYKAVLYIHGYTDYFFQ